MFEKATIMEIFAAFDLELYRYRKLNNQINLKVYEIVLTLAEHDSNIKIKPCI